ncbi:uncharacterized protein [Triticum aestivum]|uniref:uncharacterized protein n=1 Tax=Triticum aestivum TaxID=4565 RepID=UPI001D02DFAA|nr:uncharacterized protein LOC123120952 [Triticum aestivum]
MVDALKAGSDQRVERAATAKNLACSESIGTCSRPTTSSARRRQEGIRTSALIHSIPLALSLSTTRSFPSSAPLRRCLITVAATLVAFGREDVQEVRGSRLRPSRASAQPGRFMRSPSSSSASSTTTGRAGHLLFIRIERFFFVRLLTPLPEFEAPAAPKPYTEPPCAPRESMKDLWALLLQHAC